MSKSIANGNSVDLPMDAGKSIKLGWLGGTYSVKIIAGAASLPVALATDSVADASFGPYANGVILRVSTSAVGRVEYDVATTPEFHPPGSSYVRQSDGVPVVLSGLGTAAAFVPDGGGTSSSTAVGTDPLKFQKTRAAVNRARTGGANVKFLGLGDSTNIGSAATGIGYVSNGRAKNRLVALADMLASQGYMAANAQGTFGTGNNSTTVLNAFDTRFVLTPASWASSTATYLNTLGRGTFLSTGAGSWALTPRDKNGAIVQCTNFAIYYAKNVGLGTVNVDINGSGTVVLDASNATPAVAVLNISAALGDNTLNISGAAGTVPILGFRAWNSAVPCIEIWQAGAGGAKAADTVGKTSPWNAQNMMELTLQPDLTEISVGINDWAAGTSLASFTASVQAMITSALVTGDCYLVTPPPSAITSTPLATQQLYVDALIDLAKTNNIVCLDLWRRWVSYEIAQPLGYYRGSGDPYHPRDIGYSDWASMTTAMLRQL